jgi:hypothetical protein
MLPPINHDVGVALVHEEVQSPFEDAKQRAETIVPTLKHCSTKIFDVLSCSELLKVRYQANATLAKNDAVATTNLIRRSVQEVRRLPQSSQSAVSQPRTSSLSPSSKAPSKPQSVVSI